MWTMREEPVEVDGALTGDISRRARHRARFRCVDERSRMVRKAPKQRCQILRPAFAKETEQRVEFIRRQGGRFGEARIVAILPRKHRKRDGSFVRKR